MPQDSCATNRKLRVGIFGAGKMAKSHIHAISSQENAQLVAIADPAINKIKVNSHLPANVSVFSDPAGLLSEMKPDTVHICSPPETHLTLSILALRHSANIYVEKPFALSVRDAREVVTLAGELGLRVCAGHQLLFAEATQKANAILKKIGKIVHVESYFSFNPNTGSSEGRKVLSPLEQLVDILPHPVYLLLHFMKYGLDSDSVDAVTMKSKIVNTRGNVHAIFCCQDVTGNLFITLEGRPIESYVRVIGTNGCLHADFVRGSVFALAGPGISGISKVINPYNQSWQMFSRTSIALLKRAVKKQKSYPGLFEIIKAFYDNIVSNKPLGISKGAIIETVAICEELAQSLQDAEAEENDSAEIELTRKSAHLQPVDKTRGGVLITGGTGFLGRVVAEELRERNWATRVVSRRVPPASKKIAGVEYAVADLAEDVPNKLFENISVVVHCAAETAGGREAHARNSVEATRNILVAMAKNGVTKLIHISSIAVLKSSRETGNPVTETTQLVSDFDERGPYVWGKVKSEREAWAVSKNLGIDIRVIRPGALVDYDAFEPPGRLGREVGPFFICVGSRKGRIGICEVHKAAEVITMYVEDFENMPSALNLIEPETPINRELISHLLSIRPDLRIVYFPMQLLWIISPGLKLIQKILRPGSKPIDIYAIFGPEEYNNNLVTRIFAKVK